MAWCRVVYGFTSPASLGQGGSAGGACDHGLVVDFTIHGCNVVFARRQVTAEEHVAVSFHDKIAVPA